MSQSVALINLMHAIFVKRPAKRVDKNTMTKTIHLQQPLRAQIRYSTQPAMLKFFLVFLMMESAGRLLN
ncbi:hypothetical protein UW163_12135 [Ralstonia solanacearum]|uniref:Uncharacterized protein n=1 Tax=Ralstonia solanacearum TaxID=305 RepID=A0A5H2Q0U2_RALSL|nr:hypothetical protein UW163_12135 [Ralstonia solanacearum]AMP75331.1 hypothetical protein RALBFv3_14660 [Ralstonia solanacearum]AYB61054.1 hypothetical protein C2124_11015 [Ralstonia solanacearum]